ncbi:hypothetical protein [Bradyrhizobium jicamae]|nr:hypothetical protein [Bradyrhizobium jicamae]
MHKTAKMLYSYIARLLLAIGFPALLKQPTLLIMTERRLFS